VRFASRDASRCVAMRFGVRARWCWHWQLVQPCGGPASLNSGSTCTLRGHFRYKERQICLFFCYDSRSWATLYLMKRSISALARSCILASPPSYSTVMIRLVDGEPLAAPPLLNISPRRIDVQLPLRPARHAAVQWLRNDQQK